MNSKVPYSGCKAEEEGEGAQPHQQPAFSTFENETRICVHYPWSGVTILNLLFPPLFFFLASAGESIYFIVYYGSSRALFLIRVEIE